MRRRLASLLIAALLGAVVLLPSAALPAGADTDTDAAIVLATEAGEGEGEGLEPAGPDATENEFAPPPYEANVTWRAGLYIFALVALAALGMALAYYLKVVRPRNQSQQAARSGQS